ncbi:hypothetical protein Tco_1082763 [Tanacetum coccineum]|uniref:Uncharacterized protein n=1 Tax=Tanacetum coccineum TaxID=301880 RepID=A0ABQ5I1D1_9ASTR
MFYRRSLEHENARDALIIVLDNSTVKIYVHHVLGGKSMHESGVVFPSEDLTGGGCPTVFEQDHCLQCNIPGAQIPVYNPEPEHTPRPTIKQTLDTKEDDDRPRVGQQESLTKVLDTESNVAMSGKSQRQAADDHAVQHITLPSPGARALTVDTLEYTGSSHPTLVMIKMDQEEGPQRPHEGVTAVLAARLRPVMGDESHDLEQLRRNERACFERKHLEDEKALRASEPLYRSIPRTSKSTKDHLKDTNGVVEERGVCMPKFFQVVEFWIPKVHSSLQYLILKCFMLDPAKIEALKNWAISKTPTEIRTVLRSCCKLSLLDALSRKNGTTIKSSSFEEVMPISLDLPKQILNAQTERSRTRKHQDRLDLWLRTRAPTSETMGFVVYNPR